MPRIAKAETKYLAGPATAEYVGYSPNTVAPYWPFAVVGRGARSATATGYALDSRVARKRKRGRTSERIL